MSNQSMFMSVARCLNKWRDRATDQAVATSSSSTVRLTLLGNAVRYNIDAKDFLDTEYRSESAYVFAADELFHTMDKGDQLVAACTRILEQETSRFVRFLKARTFIELPTTDNRTRFTPPHLAAMTDVSRTSYASLQSVSALSRELYQYVQAINPAKEGADRLSDVPEDRLYTVESMLLDASYHVEQIVPHGHRLCSLFHGALDMDVVASAASHVYSLCGSLRSVHAGTHWHQRTPVLQASYATMCYAVASFLRMLSDMMYIIMPDMESVSGKLNPTTPSLSFWTSGSDKDLSTEDTRLTVGNLLSVGVDLLSYSLDDADDGDTEDCDYDEEVPVKRGSLSSTVSTCSVPQHFKVPEAAGSGEKTAAAKSAKPVSRRTSRRDQVQGQEE